MNAIQKQVINPNPPNPTLAHLRHNSHGEACPLCRNRDELIAKLERVLKMTPPSGKRKRGNGDG